MRPASTSVSSSSRSSPRLRVDFYESGIGETIVVTFPSGDIAVIDAHPSRHQHRPEILQIIKGKRLRFLCLTHPHADHGVDLIEVLENHGEIDSFWHTIFDIPALIYGIEQMTNFPSGVREYAAKMNQNWGEFLLDICAAVISRKIPRHLLRADLAPITIDGIEVHCLSPEESVQNEYFDAYKQKLTKPLTEVPDANSLSAILAFRFGEGVLLLGADALRKNWETAIKRHYKHGLPKAQVLKVPHHGAKNALDMQNKAKTYLDICSHNPKAKAVIFAGDSKHPNDDVYIKLKSRLSPICLSNGRKPGTVIANPLRLQIPGARAVYPAPVCNPIVSFEMDAQGAVTCLAGIECEQGCV